MDFTQFRRLVRNGEVEPLEELWLQLLESRPVDAALALGALEFMWNCEMHDQALEFFEMLEHELLEAGQPQEAREVLERHASFTPDDGPLKDRYTRCMRAIYAAPEHQIEECLSAAGVLSDEPLDRSIAKLKGLMTFLPGDVLRHGTWGLGVVRRLEPRSEGLIVDFPGRPGHRFAMGLAARALSKVDPQSFGAHLATDPDGAARRTREDPASLVREVLKAFPDGMNLADLRERMVGTLLTAEDWPQWWQTARDALIHDHFAEISTGSNPTIRLREQAVDPVAHIIAKAGAEADPARRAELVRRLLGRVKDPQQYQGSLSRLAERLAGWSSESHGDRMGTAFCLKLLAEQAAALAGEDAGALALPQFVPPQEAGELARWLRDMNAAQHAEKFLDWLETTGSPAVACAPEVAFEHGPGSAREAVMRRMRRREPERLSAIVRRLLGEPERYLPACLWLTRQIARGKLELPEGFSLLGLYSNLSVAANRLGSGGLSLDPKQRKSLSADSRALLMDETFIRLALQTASVEDCQALREALKKLHALDDRIPRAVEHQVEQVRPDLLEAEKELRAAAQAILTSPVGLKRRQEEFHKLIQEDIPRNKRELGEAIGFGDLSENAEYDAARAEQLRLMALANTIQQELGRARVPGLDEIDPDRAGFGTRVRIRRLEGEDEQTVTYDLLGPWESEPASGVISYRSPIAEAIEGAASGDERLATITGRKVRYRLEEVEISPLLLQALQESTQNKNQ